MIKECCKQDLVDFIRTFPEYTIKVVTTIKNGYVTCIAPINTICGAELHCSPNTRQDLEDFINALKTLYSPLEPFILPYTGHTPEELNKLLNYINKQALAVEVLDAFLAEYARTKNIDKALGFAQSEWDL